MKEHPILFNTAMVKAILEGRKTQTRRTVKAKKGADCSDEMWIDKYALKDVVEWKEQEGRWFGCMGYRTLTFADCPYGEVGDRLWVRETWSTVNLYGEIALAYKADSEVIRVVENDSFQDEDGLINYDDPRLEKYSFAAWADDLLEGKEGNWKPSIHMPRWVSRIQLEITNIRIERLKDISKADAIAEGCDNSKSEAAIEIGWYEKPIKAFERLWNAINGGDSWNENPWVWVVEFKIVPVK
ncbi:hypothetical protein [Acinetobacter venetianus]|uniref:hypothetical protein n=1 Tax=Acinetobacter venetianus TaxID=52133 RepID=UPI003A956E1E